MKLPFGWQIARGSAIDQAVERAAEQAVAKALSSPGGAWSVIYDHQVGAFEQGLPPLTDSQMTEQACVYACVNLIANSIAKLPLDQIELKDGAWQIVPPNYPLLTRPSKIANRITWVHYLVASMLTKGAAFGLKRYENRQVRYIELLHPSTEVLVSETGEAFYRLNANIYSHLPESTRLVPAEHIFHLPYNTMIHPLMGVPPLHAARAAAQSGSAVMSKQARTHGQKPEVYGFLKIPQTLTDTQAAAAKAAWQASNAEGAGVAVLRNGVEFSPLTFTAKEAESAAALNLANEDIARAFGVPKHLLGIGTIPSAANAEALMLGFYSQTLQPIAELIELGLDEALELPANIGVQFDVKALSRLDSQARSTAHQLDLNSGKISINEARAEDGLPPVEGGERPRVQMQDVLLGASDAEPESEIDEDDEVDKAQLYQLTKDTASTASEVKALQAAMARVSDDVSGAVAIPIAELKSLVNGLSEQVQKQRADFDQRIKAADDLLLETQAKHQAELEEIRNSVNDRSDIEGLAKGIESLTARVESAISRERAVHEAALEEVQKQLVERDAQISELRDMLAESSAEREGITAKFASLQSELAEIKASEPEPSEAMRQLQEQFEAKVSELEERLSKFMHFDGSWEDAKYDKGSTVCFKNSLWVATRDTGGRPGDDDSGWQLCVKSGKLSTSGARYGYDR